VKYPSAVKIAQMEKSKTKYSKFFNCITIVSFLIAVTVFAWALSDASFYEVSWLVAARLGLIDSNNAALLRMLRWDMLGSRLTLMYSLLGLGMITTWLSVAVAARHQKLTRTLTCVLLGVLWVLPFALEDPITKWRTYWQVKINLLQFKDATVVLSQKQTFKVIEISPKVSYVSSPGYPEVLMNQNMIKYPRWETFGLLINNGKDGVIRFDLAAATDCSLEYHPYGTFPSKYLSGYGYESPPVKWKLNVDANWFLVKYSSAKNNDRSEIR